MSHPGILVYMNAKGPARLLLLFDTYTTTATFPIILAEIGCPGPFGTSARELDRYQLSHAMACSSGVNQPCDHDTGACHLTLPANHKNSTIIFYYYYF